MGYKTEKLKAEEAFGLAERFPYALLYMISEVRLLEAGKSGLEADGEPAFGTIDRTQCLEARFFGDREELHILPDGGGAVLISDDTDQSDTITEESELADRFSGAGHKLVIRKYLKQDEDGQYYVVLTRLAGIR